MKKILEKLRISQSERNFFCVFMGIVFVLAAISIFILPHELAGGDGVSYVDAMHVLTGSPISASDAPPDFVMHRLLTTFLGLESILLLSLIFGKITTAWLVWCIIFYLLINIVFYKLLFKIFKSSKTAFIGGLFFAANYGIVIFGLTYFMDIGGWFFYCLSIYFLYSYIESTNKKDLYLATVSIAAGAFFKENALVAYVPLFFVLFYESLTSFNFSSLLSSSIAFAKKITPLSLIIFTPIVIHHVDVFLSLGYNYSHWVKLNKSTYHYNSRVLEYIKNFGSLLTLLFPLSFAGLVILLRKSKEFLFDTKKKIFLASVLVSSLPAVAWPGITQRVLFMVVPGLVILACFFIKRYEKYWYAFLPVFLVYVLMSFFMNSFILNFVNLPF